MIILGNGLESKVQELADKFGADRAYTFCLLSAYTYAHDTGNLEGISKANMFISQATILNEVYGLGYKKI